MHTQKRKRKQNQTWKQKHQQNKTPKKMHTQNKNITTNKTMGEINKYTHEQTQNKNKSKIINKP